MNSSKKRDPVANFMSSWKYYHGLTKEMRLLLEIPPIDGNEKTPDFIPEMEKFLKDPWTYLNPWPYSHSAYLFTVNPQLIFFGHPRYVFGELKVFLSFREIVFIYL